MNNRNRSNYEVAMERLVEHMNDLIEEVGDRELAEDMTLAILLRELARTRGREAVDAMVEEFLIKKADH